MRNGVAASVIDSPWFPVAPDAAEHNPTPGEAVQSYRRFFRGRLHGHRLGQKLGDGRLVQAHGGQNLSGVLAQCRRRPVETDLQVSQAPQRAHLLELAPLGVGVGGDEPQHPILLVVEEGFALVEADRLARNAAGSEVWQGVVAPGAGQPRTDVVRSSSPEHRAGAGQLTVVLGARARSIRQPRA